MKYPYSYFDALEQKTHTRTDTIRNHMFQNHPTIRLSRDLHHSSAIRAL